MFLRGWPVKIKLKFTRNLSVWKPVQNLIKICSVVSKNNRQDALKTTKHYAFTSISCTTKTHHSYMTSSRTLGNKNAAGLSETLVPTYTASHTEDRNQNAKIYHCNSVTGVHMGQNVAKKITHGIWCMIFPPKKKKRKCHNHTVSPLSFRYPPGNWLNTFPHRRSTSLVKVQLISFLEADSSRRHRTRL